MLEELIDDSDRFEDEQKRRVRNNEWAGVSRSTNFTRDPSQPIDQITSDSARSLEQSGPFRRQGRLLELPILLNKVAFIALPDSGSTKCLVTTALIDHLGLLSQIRPDVQRFSVGNRQSITSIGKVMLDCAFMDLPEKSHVETFWVLDRMIDGVSTILGRSYLENWQILTRYQFRLQTRTLQLGARAALLTAIPDRPLATWNALQIKLNGKLERAFPDTGCDIELVQEDWANQRGLLFKNLEPGDCNRVQFADGSNHTLFHKVTLHFDTMRHRPLELKAYDETLLLTKSTSAPRATTVDAKASWKPHANDQYRTFYVFKHLPFEIIVGQQLLDAIDAFSAHRDAFIDVGADCRVGVPPSVTMSTERPCLEQVNGIRPSGWLSQRLHTREPTEQGEQDLLCFPSPSMIANL